MMPPLSTLSAVIIAVLVAILIAVFLFAWHKDIQTERFRASLTPGQKVYYKRGPELSRGIIIEVGPEAVRLIDSLSLTTINVEKHNIYQP